MTKTLGRSFIQGCGCILSGLYGSRSVSDLTSVRQIHSIVCLGRLLIAYLSLELVSCAPNINQNCSSKVILYILFFPRLYIFSDAFVSELEWVRLPFSPPVSFHEDKAEQPLSDPQQKIIVYVRRYRFESNISKNAHPNRADYTRTHKHTQHETDSLPSDLWGLLTV